MRLIKIHLHPFGLIRESVIFAGIIWLGLEMLENGTLEMLVDYLDDLEGNLEGLVYAMVLPIIFTGPFLFCQLVAVLATREGRFLHLILCSISYQIIFLLMVFTMRTHYFHSWYGIAMTIAILQLITGTCAALAARAAWPMRGNR